LLVVAFGANETVANVMPFSAVSADWQGKAGKIMASLMGKD